MAPLVVADADSAIIEAATPDDIAVTRDIPLAAALVEREVVVLNDRGDRYTAENVGERLSRRDFAKELRDAGLMTESGRKYGQREIAQFSNCFDRELTSRGH